MKASDVKGKTVIVIGQAERLGHVDDVALDMDGRSIAGLWTGSPGLFNRGPVHFVSRDVIRSIGEDAVTINLTGLEGEAPPQGQVAEEVRNYRDQDMAWPRVSDLNGARVVSEGGNLLGEVREIEFDPDTLRLVGFYLSPKGGSWRSNKELMPIDVIISHSDDLIVVPEGTAALLGGDVVEEEGEVVEEEGEIVEE